MVWCLAHAIKANFKRGRALPGFAIEKENTKKQQHINVRTINMLSLQLQFPNMLLSGASSSTIHLLTY